MDGWNGENGTEHGLRAAQGCLTGFLLSLVLWLLLYLLVRQIIWIITQFSQM